MIRTRTTTIAWGTPETNRDHGKQFLLTEMPAAEAEEIAIRVLGGRFPDAIMTYGMAGIAILGIPALYSLPFDVSKPIWDRIMACVRPVGTESAPASLRADSVIEEVATRVQLRLEVLELHLGFSLADARRVLSDLARSAEATSETSQTSPSASPQSSPAGSQP